MTWPFFILLYLALQYMKNLKIYLHAWWTSLHPLVNAKSCASEIRISYFHSMSLFSKAILYMHISSHLKGYKVEKFTTTVFSKHLRIHHSTSIHCGILWTRLEAGPQISHSSSSYVNLSKITCWTELLWFDILSHILGSQLVCSCCKCLFITLRK